MKWILVIAFTLSLFSACGKKEEDPVVANLQAASRSIGFTYSELVTCSGGSYTSYDGGKSVTFYATKIEFRKKSGEFFVINLPQVSRGESDSRRSEVVTQGMVDASVAWGSADGSYSTALNVAGPADATQTCTATFNYSSGISKYEVTCTNILGLKAGEKASMHLSGRCTR